MQENEFSLNELDNILGGANKEASTERELENPQLYRQKMIESLKQEKEKLERITEETNNNIQRKNR